MSSKKDFGELGELLVAEKIINLSQLAEVKAYVRTNETKFIRAIIKLNFIQEQELLNFISRHYSYTTIDLDSFEVDKEAINLINKDVCEKYNIIPVSKAGNTIVVAFEDPGDLFVKDDIQFITKSHVEFVIASERSIREAIKKYYLNSNNDTKHNDIIETVSNRDSPKNEIQYEIANKEIINTEIIKNDAQIVDLINSMIADAIHLKASDIHIEPYETTFRIRFRIDGDLREISKLPIKFADSISNRIKIMAQLNVAEKQLPQTGNFKVKLSDNTYIDFRTSYLPTVFGEKIAIKILDKSVLQKDITTLGLELDELKILKEVIRQHQGMILITGPTGSGKTTTVYSLLEEVNKTNINISTAEDPIELNIDGVNQAQVSPEIGFTFSTALKTFLHQDSDIIMIGEIKDLETAEIAFKASATGHLVISTLTTNDTIETISLLLDMGIKPYVVSNNLSLIISQKLIAKNCMECSEPIKVANSILLELGVKSDEIKEYRLIKGKGCSVCNNTGLNSRIAIFELLAITNELKQAIINNSNLHVVAHKYGMRTLRESALLKLKMGLTNIEEVLATSIKGV